MQSTPHHVFTEGEPDPQRGTGSLQSYTANNNSNNVSGISLKLILCQTLFKVFCMDHFNQSSNDTVTIQSNMRKLRGGGGDQGHPWGLEDGGHLFCLNLFTAMSMCKYFCERAGF